MAAVASAVASAVSLLLLTASLVADAQSAATVAGLSTDFYSATCPSVEKIIRNHLKKLFRKDIGLAAALLRLHFHDCFVQGCDASVLLDGSAAGPGEQDAPPNLSLRREAFDAIGNLRDSVDKKCGAVVSCADIVALAARDSVYVAGGPHYDVPLGRRDGVRFATVEATLASLPPPTDGAAALIDALENLNLDATDLVALSGGHTIGRAHCSSFTGRLYPTLDPTMDQTFARNLRKTCPAVNSTATTPLDLRTPDTFDNRYYVDLMNRQGLFTSDQDLYTHRTTRPIVTRFAVNESVFFEQFSLSMIKMGQLNVLTGRQGEIRLNCSAPNSASVTMASVGDDGADVAAY